MTAVKIVPPPPPIPFCAPINPISKPSRDISFRARPTRALPCAPFPDPVLPPAPAPDRPDARPRTETRRFCGPVRFGEGLSSGIEGTKDVIDVLRDCVDVREIESIYGDERERDSGAVDGLLTRSEDRVDVGPIAGPRDNRLKSIEEESTYAQSEHSPLTKSSLI